MSDEPIGNGLDADERPSGGGYVTPRDIRIALIGVALLLVALTPLYRFYRDETNFTTCRQNLLAVSKAIEVYAQENNDRLPVAFVRDAQGEPYLEDGKPVTWATSIRGYMNARKTMRCPSAETGDECTTVGPTSTDPTLTTTYGMYFAVETQPINTFVDPSATILVAETISGGKRGSLDPKPLLGGNDGFLIGVDSGNFRNPQVLKAANWVTRLAFADLQKGGGVNAEARANHRKGHIAITLAGNAYLLSPEQAMIQRDLQGEIGAPWAVPAGAADKFEPNR